MTAFSALIILYVLFWNLPTFIIHFFNSLNLKNEWNATRKWLWIIKWSNLQLRVLGYNKAGEWCEARLIGTRRIEMGSQKRIGLVGWVGWKKQYGFCWYKNRNKCSDRKLCVNSKLWHFKMNKWTTQNEDRSFFYHFSYKLLKKKKTFMIKITYQKWIWY